MVCAVRHLQPEAQIHTFSFVAEDGAISEEPWIDQAAEHVGVVQHKVRLQKEDLAQELDAMIRSQGEPFGSTSIYAQRRVFQLAREAGVVVTLDGQGADELFGGYDGYPAPRLATLLLRGDVIGAWKFFRATTSWPGRRSKEVFLRLIREFVPESALGIAMRLCGRSPKAHWLDMPQLRDAGIRPRVSNEIVRMYPCRDRMRSRLAYEMTWHGLPHLLRHGDRNAMAVSVESRVPFLTREMAEFALSLPEEYLVDSRGCTKAVFRAAMRGIVPDSILDRRDKIGFETPEKQWIFSLADWVEEILHEAKDIPYLRMDRVRKEWRRILAGERPFSWLVWRWINYIRWCELFL